MSADSDIDIDVEDLVSHDDPERDARIRREAQSALKRWPILTSSTPQRRDGYRTLPNIPTEIYYEIFDHFQLNMSVSGQEYKRLLSTLIPVCRLFRALLLPRRLRSLTLSSTQKNLVKFATTTFSYPEPEDNLFAFVQQLYITDWIPRRPITTNLDPFEQDDDELPDSPTEIWVYKGILQKISHSFMRFANVQVLTLNSVPIEHSFFTMMSCMISLHMVNICDSWFSRNESRSSGDHKPKTPWTRFIFCNNHGYSSYLPALASLAASPSLAVFRTLDWDVTEALLSRPEPFTGLTEISLACVGYSFLRNFLESTPTIRSLTITLTRNPHLLDADEAHLRLPPSALPNLNILRCPSFLAGDLVVGRSVDHLNIRGIIEAENGAVHQDEYLWLDTSLTALCQRSSVPIRDLSVTAYALVNILDEEADDGLADSMAQLKELTRLTLYVAEDEDIMLAGLYQFMLHANKPVHPTIRTVRFRYEWKQPVNLAREHDLIARRFARAFPRATMFSLSMNTEWHLRGQEWAPVVLDRDRMKMTLLRFAERGTQGVRDWEGCLKGLFGERELTWRVLEMLEPN
ncbi:hypothetical protein EWM64_g932 [Hericium alpestre]|uniref:Uncharacterized protein n=1 Tax=Hericium alpestre TaxID=135208 RepID=A0A4Z0A7Q7_9AGAM|nr:hypothetical protein EWM64_g932 [Hericium alpestre]